MKLYWRVKRDGKWTFIACEEKDTRVYYLPIHCECAQCKEEEE